MEEGRFRSLDQEGRPFVRPGAFTHRETIVFRSLCLPAHAPAAAPSGTAAGARVRVTTACEDYVVFPVMARRDAWQATVELPLIVRCLGIPRSRRILEVGCGQATALVPLAARCAPRRLVGLDVDGGLLKGARRHLDASGVTAELLQADIRRMPFPDGAFDIVLDFGTCYHIANPQRALAEIARVLAPGGRLIHETPLGQLLAHPVRTSGRSLPWSAVPTLVPHRQALLFASRVKE
jgi:SAM-dependent methyltransferase